MGPYLLETRPMKKWTSPPTARRGERRVFSYFYFTLERASSMLVSWSPGRRFSRCRVTIMRNLAPSPQLVYGGVELGFHCTFTFLWLVIITLKSRGYALWSSFPLFYTNYSTCYEKMAVDCVYIVGVWQCSSGEVKNVWPGFIVLLLWLLVAPAPARTKWSTQRSRQSWIARSILF